MLTTRFNSIIGAAFAACAVSVVAQQPSAPAVTPTASPTAQAAPTIPENIMEAAQLKQEQERKRIAEELAKTRAKPASEQPAAVQPPRPPFPSAVPPQAQLPPGFSSLPPGGAMPPPDFRGPQTPVVRGIISVDGVNLAHVFVNRLGQFVAEGAVLDGGWQVKRVGLRSTTLCRTTPVAATAAPVSTPPARAVQPKVAAKKPAAQPVMPPTPVPPQCQEVAITSEGATPQGAFAAPMPMPAPIQR